MVYEAYCWLHQIAKKILRNTKATQFQMVNLDSDIEVNNPKETWFNDIQLPKGDCMLMKSQAFPIENIIANGAFPMLNESFQKKKNKHNKGISIDHAEEKWIGFIERAQIPQGYRNASLCYAGYILECEEWCLPSWTWTNAAVIRLMSWHDMAKAKQMADVLLHLQCESGGWVVRNDYSANGMIPMLAPNDSAYLANNGLLSVYRITQETQYLEAAEKCAAWIISTAREDGLVWVGMNAQTGQWIQKNNIVDIGFTAGLFAELYTITGKEYYKAYLEKFIDTYINLFQKEDGSFATGLNEKDEQIGGAFGRGQAWALEGLIPAYEVLREDKIKAAIDGIIDNLLKKQKRSGGWAYNLDRPLLGLDCKAASVIGMSLVKWYPYSANQLRMKDAIQKALNWCLTNTVNDESNACGGIFSYCMEGAIVHHLYTSTAFVYSNVYAVEMLNTVRKWR